MSSQKNKGWKPLDLGKPYGPPCTQELLERLKEMGRPIETKETRK